MTDKFYLKEVCGEYKFYEEGDVFPLTEKQILNKLNENKELSDENQQLKNRLNDLEINWHQNLTEFDKDTLLVKDEHIEIRLKDRRLHIKVITPSREVFEFFYIVTGRNLMREFIAKYPKEFKP